MEGGGGKMGMEDREKGEGGRAETTPEEGGRQRGRGEE